MEIIVTFIMMFVTSAVATDSIAVSTNKINICYMYLILVDMPNKSVNMLPLFSFNKALHTTRVRWHCSPSLVGSLSKVCNVAPTTVSLHLFICLRCVYVYEVSLEFIFGWVDVLEFIFGWVDVFIA